MVNAANVRLQHSGGLALALCRAGGPQIQHESNHYISQFGLLNTGDAITTNAGTLPCKKIIHAVGPIVSPKPTPAMVSKAEKKLTKSVWSILKVVEQQKFHSVAIPALSSGIFNFPLTRCSETIVRAIQEYYNQQKTSDTPLQINLVNNDQKTVRAMERACFKILSTPKMSTQSAQPQNSQESLSQGHLQTAEMQVCLTVN